MKKPWRDLLMMMVVTAGVVLASFLIPGDESITNSAEPPIANMEDEPAKETAPTIYGLNPEAYTVQKGTVGRNETLADILLEHGVSLTEIYNISLLPDSLLDERKMRRGNSYAFLSPADSTSADPTEYFVYEKDPLNYVRVGIAPDSIWAVNSARPVVTRIEFATGTIESSLWESMLEKEINPMLAIELSEIFAWSIDFFGIQRGDQYKVIYQESFVDSQSIGITKVMGAWFYHNDTDFWAIPFTQDGERSFFDEEGNSLRKAFLKAPLRYSRISSGFSHSRMHPILKIRRPHHGVDYAAPAGTPVQTVGDGVITAMGYQRNGGGNYVKIKHNSVYSTTYMHLSRFGKGIRQGVYVKQGDVIGYVGSTGLASGPHLDFRFYRNGSAVNPLRVEAPPVEPVEEENLSAYWIVSNFTMQALKLL